VVYLLAYFTHLPAKHIHGGESVKQLKIFMVSVNKQGNKFLAVKPFKPIFFFLASILNAAEITADYKISLLVLFRGKAF